MEKEVLRAIAGIDIYPVVSLVIFFVFFVIIIIRTIKADKRVIEKMSNLPLENNNETKNRDEGVIIWKLWINLKLL